MKHTTSKIIRMNEKYTDEKGYILCESVHWKLFFFFVFLGPYPWHMDIPRLGVKLELQLLATAMQDLSCVCDLHHSSWQCWVLNALNKARDQTHIKLLKHQKASLWKYREEKRWILANIKKPKFDKLREK